MISYWQPSSMISDSIYIPKYYNPEISSAKNVLEGTHDCRSIRDLVDQGILSVWTGDEIGKAAYGTGDIPFVRTSDIANWEIKTSPKQGVSTDIYKEYATGQDVQIGDILFVRDGTYLIGTNCFITAIDKEILYQSHVLKIRVNDKSLLDPHLLFLAFNCPYVQRQVRSFQFTADIIDTIGQRFFEIIIPIPKDISKKTSLVKRTESALSSRMLGKAFVKHCPTMIEEVLATGKTNLITDFLHMPASEMVGLVSNETVTAEFGSFTAFTRNSATIINQIYLPTYYDIEIPEELNTLSETCDLKSISQLRHEGILSFHVGDEIGKMAYGTGEIPFLRTSDFSNWEINHNAKQGVSEDIYLQYAKKQDMGENDILLVRDGTYLVGTSCIVTKEDVKSLFCGGMFKFRLEGEKLDPFLFLGLLNSYIVKRQMRTKQFTRDVIDTLGNRIEEVIIPVPKSKEVRQIISDAVRGVVQSRVTARIEISKLTREIAKI